MSEVAAVRPIGHSDPIGTKDMNMNMRYWLRGTALAASAMLLTGLAACAPHGGGDPTPSTVPSMSSSSQSLDLIGADTTWKFTPGVGQEVDALSVHSSSQALLTFTDNDAPDPLHPTYVENPPVNYYGTHLAMKQSGNVTVKAALTNMNGASTVSFLTLPNVRHDESLALQAGVDVRVNGAQVTITERDQLTDTTDIKAESTVYTSTRNASDKTADIQLTQDGDELAVVVDGTKTELDTPLFDRQIWIGLDAAQSFTVSELTAEPLYGNEISSVDTSKIVFGARTKNGLAGTAAAAGYTAKEIGTAADLPNLVSNPALATFTVQNFNSLVPEMVGKFQNVHPEDSVYDFSELDAFVDFANRHDMNVHGHTLVFGEAFPGWLAKKLSTASRDEAIAIMTDHITTVMTRYDGKHGHGTITNWDVDNEIFDPENYKALNHNTIWAKAIGDDYPEIALRAARNANPQAKLGFNEYAIETDDDRAAAVGTYAISLHRKGLVDYVGLQMHYFDEDLQDGDAVDRLSDGRLAEWAKALADEGIAVRPSEISVERAGNTKRQARVYADTVKFGLQTPNSMGFSVWGTTANTGRFAYFTGSPKDRDPGDDAATTQTDDGPIKVSAAWLAMLDAASQKK